MGGHTPGSLSGEDAHSGLPRINKIGEDQT